jgi:hypothetical protein
MSDQGSFQLPPCITVRLRIGYNSCGWDAVPLRADLSSTNYGAPRTSCSNPITLFSLLWIIAFKPMSQVQL